MYKKITLYLKKYKTNQKSSKSSMLNLFIPFLLEKSIKTQKYLNKQKQTTILRL